MSSSASSSLSIKGGRGRRASKSSRSEKAELAFPVGKVDRCLREGKYSERIGADAPVYLAGVLEYLACEFLDVAGNIAIRAGKRRITPTHIQMALQQDGELNKLCENPLIPGAGVLPDQAFLAKTKGKEKGASTST